MITKRNICAEQTQPSLFSDRVFLDNKEQSSSKAFRKRKFPQKMKKSNMNLVGRHSVLTQISFYVL
jgi:hypothetical protein